MKPPVPRKPEEITVKLSSEDAIKAMSSLGYDLRDYVTTSHIVYICFELKEKPNEKTKATT